jgi:hypothetical protein
MENQGYLKFSVGEEWLINMNLKNGGLHEVGRVKLDQCGIHWQ